MKTRVAVSAGGLIVDDEGRVVVTARRSFKGELQWGLPKGLVEKGESNEAAALREAEEYTGLEVEMERPLTTIDYWYVEPGRAGNPPTRVHKFVHYFLMRATGGDPSAHDAETEEVAFLSREEAIDRISFKSEKSVVAEALATSGAAEL